MVNHTVKSLIHKVAGLTAPSHFTVSTGTILVEFHSVWWTASNQQQNLPSCWLLSYWLFSIQNGPKRLFSHSQLQDIFRNCTRQTVSNSAGGLVNRIVRSQWLGESCCNSVIHKAGKDVPSYCLV